MSEEAGILVLSVLEKFLQRSGVGKKFAGILEATTGTRLLNWVDHIEVNKDIYWDQLIVVGYKTELVPTRSGTIVLHHPEAQLPHFVVRDDLWLRLANDDHPRSSLEKNPTDAAVIGVAIKCDSLLDFRTKWNVKMPIEGTVGYQYARCRFNNTDGSNFWVVERHDYRGFNPVNITPI